MVHEMSHQLNVSISAAYWDEFYFAQEKERHSLQVDWFTRHPLKFLTLIVDALSFFYIASIKHKHR